MRHENHVSVLPLHALIPHARTLAADERHSVVELLLTIARIDQHRLYLAEGYNSLYTYCVKDLCLSEGTACDRMEAARAIRTFPAAIPLLRSGELTVTNLRLLIPVLTPENHASLLDRARKKSKLQVQELVVEVRPRSETEPSVRHVPAGRLAPSLDAARQPTLTHAEATATAPAEEMSSASSPALSHSSRPVVAPLSPARFRIQFTADQETHDDLRRLQSLMRHQIPNGDPAVIIKRALRLLRLDVEKQKFGTVARPRKRVRPLPSSSRQIPRQVRREVSARDGERCAFVGSRGRCDARDKLEFHHVVPFARGGKTTADNLELRCRAHNAYEAERDFGGTFMDSRRPAARP